MEAAAAAATAWHQDLSRGCSRRSCGPPAIRRPRERVANKPTSKHGADGGLSDGAGAQHRWEEEEAEEEAAKEEERKLESANGTVVMLKRAPVALLPSCLDFLFFFFHVSWSRRKFFPMVCMQLAQARPIFPDFFRLQRLDLHQPTSNSRAAPRADLAQWRVAHQRSARTRLALALQHVQSACMGPRVLEFVDKILH